MGASRREKNLVNLGPDPLFLGAPGGVDALGCVGATGEPVPRSGLGPAKRTHFSKGGLVLGWETAWEYQVL